MRLKYSLFLFLTILLFTGISSFALNLPQVKEEEVKKEETIQKELAKKSLPSWRDNFILTKRLNSDQKRLLFTGYKLMLSSVGLVTIPEKKLACDPGFFLEKVPVGNEPYFKPLVDAGYIKQDQIEFVVNYVIPGSAAEKAGLKIGDIIVAINGKKATQNTESNLRKREEKVNTFISQMCFNSYSVHKIEIFRITNGSAENLVFDIVPDKIPAVGLKIVDNSKLINAWTDGKNIYLTTGIMNFFENDDQLAAVLGHELAHVILDHPESTAKRKTIGELVGLSVGIVVSAATGIDTTRIFAGLGSITGSLIYSKKQEKEADYTMMYLLALTGYNYEKAPEIFRRLAQLNPESIKGSYLSTHPGTAERYVILEKAISELKGLSKEEIRNKYLSGMKIIKTEKEKEENKNRRWENESM